MLKWALSLVDEGGKESPAGQLSEKACFSKNQIHCCCLQALVWVKKTNRICSKQTVWAKPEAIKKSIFVMAIAWLNLYVRIRK